MCECVSACMYMLCHHWLKHFSTNYQATAIEGEREQDILLHSGWKLITKASQFLKCRQQHQQKAIALKLEEKKVEEDYLNPSNSKGFSSLQAAKLLLNLFCHHKHKHTLSLQLPTKHNCTCQFIWKRNQQIFFSFFFSYLFHLRCPGLNFGFGCCCCRNGKRTASIYPNRPFFLLKNRSSRF